jgi:hypothetical protein
VEHSTSKPLSVVPDATGLIALGIQVYLMIRWVVPHDPSRLLMGALAFVVLASCALYMWHSEKITQQIYDSSPGLSPFNAATKAGGLFGFVLTVFLCPGLTMVAVAGLIRVLVLGSGSDRPLFQQPFVLQGGIILLL